MASKWPYSDFHELNMDWVISKIKNIDSDAAAASAAAEQAAESATAAQAAAAAIATGSPFAVTLVSQMTDPERIYLYTGSEEGYVFGDWYYYDGTGWTDGGTYGVGANLNTAIKQALLDCFANVAWANENGQRYYDALEQSFETTAVSISAVYTENRAVYTANSLDALRDNLTVTVEYADGTSAVTTGYTLSGSLNVGTNTITITYDLLTTTVDVPVLAQGYTYIPTDGLLPNQPYITFEDNTQGNLTYTLSSDGTRFYTTAAGASYHWKANFPELDFTTTAHLYMEFKVAEMGYYVSSNTNSPGMMFVYVSDGTKGSMVGFARDGSASGALKIRTAQAATVTKGATLSFNAWHTLDITFANGTQTVRLDGSAVITSATPTSGKDGYATDSVIDGSTVNNGINDFYIRKVEYTYE